MSRLAQLARPREQAPSVPEEFERCELCAHPLPPEHRHLVDLEAARLLCACRACTILFDRREAGGGHYRLVPDRRLLLRDFLLDEAAWSRLRLPVELAFFFRSTIADRIVALYPSPLGATESLLELEAWAEIERDNPCLATVEPDVEALLVNRTGDQHEAFLVPIDDCYALVGLIRSSWQGLNGGTEAWQAIRGFFAQLRGRCQILDETRKEA